MSDDLRVAMLSVHTSPLEQPGTGDAGGMNVYLTELAAALADHGAEVDIFTRATSPALPDAVPLGDGVTVRHVPAGPRDVLDKSELPGHLCCFGAGLTRRDGRRRYDVVHSHYWLSGLVGMEVAPCWDVPLVHSMHTLAKVKNAALAPGDTAEPARRVRGEEAVADAAHALVASTEQEAADLVGHYGADPAAVHVVEPGVDRALFHPGADTVDAAGLAAAQATARRELGLDPAEPLVLFAGRVQPLKAPDVLVRALASMATDGGPAPRLVVLGGPSGAPGRVRELEALARRSGVADRLVLRPPVERAVLAQWYRAADLVAVPSRSESFGLVAAEAQACGTPVVAAGVGGLRTIVADGVSGVLVPDHEPATWAAALRELLADPVRRARLAVGAHRTARHRGWDAAAEAMLKVYHLARERRRGECAVA